MTRIAVLGLVLLSATVGLAQAPVRDVTAAPPPAGSAAVTGMVRDDEGRPVRRATVTASGPQNATFAAITADDGRFALAGLPAGRFTITAKKAGYPASSYGATRPNRPGAGVLLAEGQRLADIMLTLPRGGVLAGRVFDERGQPMPGVPMMAWEVRTTLAGGRTLDFPSTGGVSVTTDDRGAYRLFGLPAGEYTVGTSWFFSGVANVRVPTDAEIRAAFAAQQRQTTDPAPALGPMATYDYSPIFLPSEADPLNAQVVELQPGQERSGLDVRMKFGRTSVLEITVTGPDGQPAAADLSIVRASAVQALNSTRVTRAGPDGRYIGSSLPAGDYIVRAQMQPRGQESSALAQAINGTGLFAAAEVTLDGSGPARVMLQLQPTLELKGRVVFTGTAAPPADLATVRLSLQPVDSNGSRTAGNATITANREFTIGGVTPGTFRVVANVPAVAGAPSPWALQSVTADGEDITDLPLTISGGDKRLLTVTLTDAIAELTGTLTNPAGKPATDYFVVVVPADRRYWLPTTRRIVNARPDVSGRFTFRGLPPGEYRIAATTDLIPRDLADATALTQLLAQSAALTISAGERKTFDIRVGQ